MSLVELRMVGNAWQMSNTLSLGCVIVLRISDKLVAAIS